MLGVLKFFFFSFLFDFKKKRTNRGPSRVSGTRGTVQTLKKHGA